MRSAAFEFEALRQVQADDDDGGRRQTGDGDSESDGGSDSGSDGVSDDDDDDHFDADDGGGGGCGGGGGGTNGSGSHAASGLLHKFASSDERSSDECSPQQHRLGAHRMDIEHAAQMLRSLWLFERDRENGVDRVGALLRSEAVLDALEGEPLDEVLYLRHPT